MAAPDASEARPTASEARSCMVPAFAIAGMITNHLSAPFLGGAQWRSEALGAVLCALCIAMPSVELRIRCVGVAQRSHFKAQLTVVVVALLFGQPCRERRAADAMQGADAWEGTQGDAGRHRGVQAGLQGRGGHQGFFEERPGMGEAWWGPWCASREGCAFSGATLLCLVLPVLCVALQASFTLIKSTNACTVVVTESPGGRALVCR